MPSTFQAVLVIVVALLPGALYVWAFERQAGRYGIALSDRVLRFVVGSAVLLAVFASPLYLFQYHVDGWIRCRLKSGTWLGGAYSANGKRSYAAGYPHPQDHYLAASVDVDPETGEFGLDDDGRPPLGSGGLLVRWEEVEYLEFIDS